MKIFKRVNIAKTRSDYSFIIVIIKLIITLFFVFGLTKALVAQPIKIKEIEVEGSTVLGEKIKSLVAPYLHQTVEERKLRRLAQQITDLYVEQGYSTSGAFLPEQEISSGIIKIQVIEGELEHTEMEGLKRLPSDYINSRLERVSQQGPLNVNELRDALGTLQLDPLIEKIKARLSEGTIPSASILLLDIKEAHPLGMTIRVNNRSSPTIGEIRGVATLSHQNVLGLRDLAFVQYDVTEGLSIYEFGYTLPLNYRGTAIGFSYRIGDSLTIEEPFDKLDIRAKANTFSAKFIQEIARSATTESSISLIFDLSESETFIFNDRPFSFPGGPEDGLSRLSVFRLEADWLKRSDTDILSIRSRFSLGVDLFDATVKENEPDGRFFSWLGQVQWAKVLDGEQKIILVTRLSTQLASDSLLPFEQFNLGGATTVRGYRHNFLLGDNGLVGTVEITFLIVDDATWGKLRLTSFVDVGGVWNNDGDFAESLTSVGLGFDWQLGDSLFVELDYAFSLSNQPERSKREISFALRFNLF